MFLLNIGRAIVTTFKRFFADILAGYHIEAYVVAIFSFGFAVLTAFGDGVSDEYKMAALLAGMGLLVYNITVPSAGAGPGRLDDYLNDRADFQPLPERIKNARTLWIYGPSAINILNDGNLRAIQDSILSNDKGNLRVMIQNPAEETEIARLVVQLDENVQFQRQDLPKAIADSLDLLGRMSQWEVVGQVNYRVLDFNPGFSLVVIDPDKPTGVAIVEFYGYTHRDTSSRMHIEISRAESEKWYTYWVNQYDEMWKAASPYPTPSVPVDPPSA